MPSSCSRCSASRRSPSRTRSPALSWVTRLGDVVALGGGVLGVAADVEVEPRAVAEEHVAAAPPADHLAEQVARHLVGAQAALPLERARDAVLVLDPEDPPVHVAARAYGREWCTSTADPAAGWRPAGRLQRRGSGPQRRQLGGRRRPDDRARPVDPNPRGNSSSPAAPRQGRGDGGLARSGEVLERRDGAADLVGRVRPGSRRRRPGGPPPPPACASVTGAAPGSGRARRGARRAGSAPAGRTCASGCGCGRAPRPRGPRSG